jgi:hypothetical protein
VRLENATRWIEPGRLGVVLGLLAGLAVFVAEASDGRGAFDAGWRAMLTAAALMVLAGIARSLWKGQAVTGAQAGPVGLQFEERTETALSTMNERLYDQMRDINERFHEIERRLARIEDDAGDERSRHRRA